MIVLLATMLMTALSTGMKMPLGISRSVAESSGRSESFSLPKMQLQVNILRRRVKLDVPSSVLLPQQLIVLADRPLASDLKTEENKNTKKCNPRFKLRGNTNVFWWLKAAKQASVSIIRSRRKLQSSSSCVDQSSFITFVNHNVRDCSWVQATGNCETYSEYCPATCSLCSGTQTDGVDLQQVLNSNIQNQAPAPTPTTASVTNSGSSETSNGTSNMNGTAVKVSSNKNVTPTPSPSHANTGSIALSQTSGVVVVSLSFTTLTDDQRKRLKANKMSIEEILTDLVTVDDILSVNSTSQGRKVLEAIVLSVTQILNADTNYFVSDGANTTSENDAVVSMIYNPSSYNSSIANDGNNGWVQLHIPYDTTLTFSRRQLQSAAIKKVKSTCSQDINNRIGDGTLLKMLQLSTDALIKDVSVFGKEDMTAVNSATNTQTGPESVGHPSSLFFFAVGVCALVLFALSVFTVYFIVEKSHLRKHASWVNNDANRVILELDLENGELKKTTNQKNDQTLDMSLQSGSLSNPPSSGELSESRDRFEPIVRLSKATELSDISCCSSKSGRLGSVATTKFSNRRLSSADRRQPQRKKSATNKSDSESELKQQQTQTSAKRSLFNIPAVGVPFAVNNRKNNSDVESTSDSIIDRILRRCKKNVGDEPSAVVSSNYSSWGDDELGSELMKVEEMVLVDPPPEEIDDSLSVHFVDVQGEEYDFSLSKYVDDAFDAIYNSAIDIDTAVASTRNWEHNDASIISDSSIDETQSTSSSDCTKDSTTVTQYSGTRAIDIDASGINKSEPSGSMDANGTSNNCAKHDYCGGFDSVAATAQHCCEYFESISAQEPQGIDPNKTSENNDEIGGKPSSTGVQQTACDIDSVSGINECMCCDLFNSSSAHGITVNVAAASISSALVDEIVEKKAIVISGEKQSTCVIESVSGITEYLTFEFISEVISDFSKDPRELAICGKKLLAPHKDNSMQSSI